MLDFGTFCYLDVEKTGSSFISQILKKVSTQSLLMSCQHGFIRHLENDRPFESLLYKNLPPSLITSQLFFERYRKRFGGRYRENCFYFNSIRNPLNYYVSLYNFGCDGNGGIAAMLHHHGFGYLYERTEGNFLRWVDFMTDERNARYIDRMYDKTCAHCVGFLTYRFLRLSLVNPLDKLSSIDSISDIQTLYERESICNFTIKNENLNNDLLFLFKNHLNKFVRSDAGYELNRGRVNSSQSNIATVDLLKSSDMAENVFNREAFVFSNFYSTQSS